MEPQSAGWQILGHCVRGVTSADQEGSSRNPADVGCGLVEYAREPGFFSLSFFFFAVEMVNAVVQMKETAKNVPVIGVCCGEQLLEMVESRQSHTANMLANLLGNLIPQLELVGLPDAWPAQQA